MSWSRGKDPEAPGKFRFECRDYAGAMFRAQGGFDTAQAADRAAERAERDVMLAMASPRPAMTMDDVLSDDELLRELGIDLAAGAK